MKQLILIRHAKSSWKYDVSDDRRPLKSRGLSDATMLSRKLNEQDISPDLILSSPAVRAQSTAEIFLKNLNIDQKDLIINQNLYDFSGEKLLNVIRNTENDVKCLMIFGHNYAITNFVNTYGDKFIDNVPTTGLVCIAFSSDSWDDLKSGKTIQTLFPRDLK